jgi:hypothetical protein
MTTIGVLYGMEESFPPALVDRINSLAVPGAVAEHLKVGGVQMAVPCPYGVICGPHLPRHPVLPLLP